MKKFITMLCIIGVTLSFANESRGGGERGSDRQPPQEAIEICEGKSADSACQMTSPHGDLVDGTCAYTPDEKYFACKPERGPRENR